MVEKCMWSACMYMYNKPCMWGVCMYVYKIKKSIYKYLLVTNSSKFFASRQFN